MEEKKTITTENVQENNQKLSYEQLNEACSQLYQQNQNLLRQLQQANLTNMFKRLDYLFNVLNYNSLFDADFVYDCVKEIKEALTVDQPEEKKIKEE